MSEWLGSRPLSLTLPSSRPASRGRAQPLPGLSQWIQAVPGLRPPPLLPGPWLGPEGLSPAGLTGSGSCRSLGEELEPSWSCVACC